MSNELPHSKMIRYHGLDHLRGVLALTVVFYHLFRWQELGLTMLVKRPLDLLGFYAVSTFYVISGAALYCVYRKRNIDVKFLKSFFIKRGFRIIPLFWFVTIVFLSFDDFSKFTSDPYRVFLNFTLLFSWIAPAEYLSPGTWSIGNEWAFYTLFPVILILARSPARIAMIFLLSLVVSVVFSELFFEGGRGVGSMWGAYVHPLNQLVFFAGGIVVGAALCSQFSGDSDNAYLKNRKIWVKGLGLVCTAIFFVISLNVVEVEAAKGGWKILLTLLCMGWCFSAGFLGGNSGRGGRILGWLGGISYSLYLIHPIVYQIVWVGGLRIVSKYPDLPTDAFWMKIIVCVVTLSGSLVAASLTYRFLEMPAMKLGKKFANFIDKKEPRDEKF